MPLENLILTMMFFQVLGDKSDWLHESAESKKFKSTIPEMPLRPTSKKMNSYTCDEKLTDKVIDKRTLNAKDITEQKDKICVFTSPEPVSKYLKCEDDVYIGKSYF